MKRRELLTLGVVGGGLTYCLPSTLCADSLPIKIGLLYSFSGLTSVSLRDAVLGHELAAEEINAPGGVLGRPLHYVVRDDRLQPAEAVKEFRRLIHREQVECVMGIFSNDVALAVSQVAKDMHVLFINTLALASALTEEHGHEYVIRTNTNSTVIARTAALMAAQGPWKTYYFLGPDYGWGSGVNTDFWEFLQRQKTDVQKMGEVSHRRGEHDFSAIIATILQAQPDAVFCSLWGDALLAFMRQARLQGFFEQVQLVATGAGDLDILRPMGSEMPDGVMATFLYAFDWHPVHEQANARFVSQFVGRAGYEPSSSGVIGYMATRIVAEAMRNANSTKADALLRTLRGGHFTTLLGDIVIRDFDGQATFDYNVGFTHTDPRYPFKRLLEHTRVRSEEVLRPRQEIEQVRYALRNQRR